MMGCGSARRWGRNPCWRLWSRGIGSGLCDLSQQAVVDVPLSGDVADVRHAIEIADVTWGHTDYVLALQAVEHVFAADTAQVKRVVHVISDFQASGMPGVRYGMAVAGRD